MIFFVDVDGVVADLHTQWLKKYNKIYGDHLKPTDITGWGIEKLVKPECGHKIFDILDDPTLYDDVEQIAGSYNGVWSLRGMGSKVVFVTSGIYQAKTRWLANNGYLLNNSNWKSPRDVVIASNKSLLSHGGNCVLIDDYPGNLKGWDNALLFTRPWNMSDKKFLRTNGWNSILSYDWVKHFSIGAPTYGSFNWATPGG